MTEKNENRVILFTELDPLVGEPVWDQCMERWRVLVGYRRYGDNHEVIFTDSKGMESWNNVELFRERAGL